MNDLFETPPRTESAPAVASSVLLGVPSDSSKPSKKKSKAWDYHRQPDGKDEWLTPPEIPWALSESLSGEKFDLDPCSPIICPERFQFAKSRLTTEHNGLTFPWDGRVWLNPPYKGIEKWVERGIKHNNTILLCFARTETKFWKRIWETADAVLFLYGRLTFHEFVCKTCGKTISQHKEDSPCTFVNSGEAAKAKWTGGAGSALIAWGDCNVDALEHAVQECGIEGKLIYLET